MFCFVFPDVKPSIHKEPCFPRMWLRPGMWKQTQGQEGDGQFQQAPCLVEEGQLKMRRPLCQSVCGLLWARCLFSLSRTHS